MRLLFINSPSRIYHKTRPEHYDSIPPIGLALLSTLAAKRIKRENVILLDAEYCGFDLQRIISEVLEFSPDVIGVNVFSPTVHIVSELVENIKAALPNVMLFLGGVHARISGKLIYDNKVFRNTVDFACIGYGEPTIEDLIAYYDGDKTDLSRIRGIAYIDDGCVKLTPKASLSRDYIDTLLLDHGFFANDMLSKDPGDIKESFILSSRGCPYTCEFCAARQLDCGKTYLRSFESVGKELSDLIAKGCTYIRFVDDLLLLNTSRIEGFLQMLSALGLSKTNFGFEANGRADIMSRLPASCWLSLHEAGLKELEIGVESGSDRILKIMRKKITLADVEISVRKAADFGIKVKAYIMAGYPEESEDDLQETIALMKTLKDIYPGGIRFSPVPVKAYPGTALFKRVEPLFRMIDVRLDDSECIDLSSYSKDSTEMEYLSSRTRYNAMHMLKGKPIALSEVFSNAGTDSVLKALAQMCLINL